MLLLVSLHVGRISWSPLLLQAFVDAIVAFCQDSSLTVGGEWLSTGRGSVTAARLPKVASSCVPDPVSVELCHMLITAVSTRQSQVSAKTAVLHQLAGTSRSGSAELLVSQTICGCCDRDVHTCSAFPIRRKCPPAAGLPQAIRHPRGYLGCGHTLLYSPGTQGRSSRRCKRASLLL